jgi:P53 DNA-binding domain
VGGINRKPLKVIFTLETGPGNVVGRYSVDVRICSCPKRDKHQEEAKILVNILLFWSKTLMSFIN